MGRDDDLGEEAHFTPGNDEQMEVDELPNETVGMWILHVSKGRRVHARASYSYDVAEQEPQREQLAAPDDAPDHLRGFLDRFVGPSDLSGV